LQFIVSVSLISATLIVYRQLDYLRSKPIGFAKEQMLVVRLGIDDPTRKPEQVESLKTELAKVSGIHSATASGGVPGNGVLNWRTTQIQNKTGQMQSGILGVYSVDYDFLNHYQIPLVAGRAFSKQFATDSSQALLVNETVVKQLGYSAPEEILGKAYRQRDKKGQVIGVIKDFHIGSLQGEIPPFCLRIVPQDFWLISLRVDTQNLPSTIARLQTTFHQLEPQQPFDYYFLDESIGQQYRTEERFGTLFVYFAGLAIFVACLGLLGLISFTTQQRAKEIGIRKVLGATIRSIVVLLSKDLLGLLLVAFGIAVPLAWYFMHKWLENFAYHVNLSGWVFALAGILTLVIAMLTLSFQSIKAARANPVKSLRSE
jgi:putative ABC transport system permease protein